MRERYLEVYDQIWIDCLNGDKYKTGKVTPDGDPDPSIFSTDRNREGIQVGTAIALFARKEAHEPAPAVRFRHLWGKTKREQLIETAQQDGVTQYEEVAPPLELGLPFVPGESNVDYFTWPSLPELFPVSFPGVKTSRDDFLVDIDRDGLVRRLEEYFDPTVGHEAMARIAPGVMDATARFNPVATRERLRKRGFLPENVVRYCYRPFDTRWVYWEPETKLLDEKRAEYFPHVFEGNVWLSAGQRNRKEAFYQPQFTTVLADHHIVESNVSMFPLDLAPEDELTLENQHIAGGRRTNLSKIADSAIESVGVDPGDLFFHALAALHAPSYAKENAAALRQDWPRIPLPDSRDALLASAELGRQIAALLDTETDVPGVTSGAIRPELRVIGAVSRAGGGALNPDAGDLSVTAGWGHGGKGGITMPGKGRIVERDYSPDELDTLRAGAEALGLTLEEALAHLRATTRDIYLNDVAYWRNVPAGVWSYTIGGYQVMKKWLSYRERSLLGRDLSKDEAREVMNMARRIAAILLLEPALDANYRAVTAATCTWGSGPEGGGA
jgi:hypothetical protein